MSIRFFTAPFSKSFLIDFRDMTAAIFGGEADEEWLDGLSWRLENMPNATVFISYKSDVPAGYKAGYALSHDQYYSWLGGVRHDFRRAGIGQVLMQAQHQWLRENGYKCVETHVDQANDAMMMLNLLCGFKATGVFLKKDKPNYILQKTL